MNPGNETVTHHDPWCIAMPSYKVLKDSSHKTQSSRITQMKSVAYRGCKVIFLICGVPTVPGSCIFSHLWICHSLSNTLSVSLAVIPHCFMYLFTLSLQEHRPQVAVVKGAPDFAGCFGSLSWNTKIARGFQIFKLPYDLTGFKKINDKNQLFYIKNLSACRKNFRESCSFFSSCDFKWLLVV